MQSDSFNLTADSNSFDFGYSFSEVLMKKMLSVIIFLTIFYVSSTACTIGIAAPSATTDGRALIWKNRDINSPTYVHNFEEDPYKFVGVGNEGSDYIWMGINEKGFGILNAIANFPNAGNGRMGNGDTMKWALGHFYTIEEFDAFLDSTNVTGRETHANMAVITSQGDAIMYEVSENNYWKFDADETEHGFVVRGNFAFNGGGTTSSTYEASLANLTELAENGNINCQSILQTQIRRFHNNAAESIPVPYDYFWNETSPFGYFPIQGISNPGNGSAVVIQGNLPEEPEYFITMWAMLGQPTASVAVPYFPVGQLPLEANSDGTSVLYYEAMNIKNQLFDYTPSSAYVDSYKLLNERDTGYWTYAFDLEENAINELDTLKTEWLQGHEIDDLAEFMSTMASEIFSFMDTVFIESAPIPNFKADINYGTPILEVNFNEISQHNPEYTSWEWDFNEDGITDSYERNPNWNYTTADSFDVSITLTNADSTFTLTKQNFIRVFDSAAEVINVNPDSLIFLTFEDALDGLPLVIRNISEIPITIDAIFQGGNSFYAIIPGIYEFPIILDAQDSLETIVTIGLPVHPQRELTADSLHFVVSNSIFSVPIYVDDSLNCDSENENISQAINYLAGNHPNPFNPATTISFNLSHEATENPEIVIYNSKGQKADQLIISNDELRIGEVVWDAKRFSSGIYFYKLVSAGATIDTKKMILLK